MYCRSGHYRSRSPKIPVVLLAVGGYLLMRELMVPAAILLGLGLLQLLRNVGASGLFDKGRALRAEIRADAARHGLQVPADGIVWNSLETLYLKRRRAAAAFPTLAADYDDVLASLWLELSQEPRLTGWQRIIKRVVEQFATPWPNGEGPLDASLGRLKRSTTLWREAQREAST